MFSAHGIPRTLGELPTASWQPQPADGANSVPAEGVTLTWAAGAEATSHIVYFGTTNPPELVGEQTDTSFATGDNVARYDLLLAQSMKIIRRA